MLSSLRHLRQCARLLPALGSGRFFSAKAKKAPIDGFFESSSYAVIAANMFEGGLSWSVTKNFTKAPHIATHVVSFKEGGDALGFPRYSAIEELPADEIECAIICTSAQRAVGDVRACCERGIKHIFVISGGFAEMGEEGVKAQQDLVDTAEEFGARIVGPNGMGCADLNTGVSTLFIPPERLLFPNKGNVSLLAQSGALACTLINRMYCSGFDNWLSRMISVGNACDVNENDVLEYFSRDEKTDQLWIYLEGFKDAPGLLKELKNATAKLPVLMFKAGRSEGGQHASGSHSASLAANDAVTDYLLKQAGAIRVSEFTDFLDIGEAFMSQPLPKGPRIGLLTNAGGTGVMAADAADKHNLVLPQFSPETVTKFYEVCPPYFPCVNPMDLTGSSNVANYAHAYKLLVEDPQIDMICFMQQPIGPNLPDARENWQQFKELTKDIVTEKPVVACFNSGLLEMDAELKKGFNSIGIPCCSTPERAVRVLARLWERAQHLERVKSFPTEIATPVHMPEVQKIIDFALADGRDSLLESESRDVFRLAGLPVPADHLALTSDEAVAFWEKVRTPVVMKLVSPQVIHKTDEHAVFVGLNSAEKVREVADDLFTRFEGRDVRGVLLYEMVPHGTEMLIGMNKDEVFGDLIVAGVGGAFVEILDDVTFGLCPVDKHDADHMLETLKHTEFLDGFRGSPAVDRDLFADMIVRLSHLAAAHPDIKEMDANPIIACPDGAHWAVDARILLEKNE